MENLRLLRIALRVFVLVAGLSSGWVTAQSFNTNLIFFLPINGNANDVSGNGLHGISTGTLVADRNGVPNSAYHFNGTGQCITMPFSPLIQPPLPLTVSFYANITTLGSIAFANNSTPALYTGVWLGFGADGKFHADYGDGGTTTSGTRKSKNSALSAGVGAWHHYVAVMRSATDMDLYIDCVNAGGVYSGGGGNLFYNANPAIMGIGAAASLSGGTFKMTGTIDEIGFWSRALSPAEVLQLCNNLIFDQTNFTLAGELNGNTASLKWESPDPMHCIGFDVERSLDGVQFAALGHLSAVDRNPIHTFEDSAPLSNHGFYRVKQTDDNGTISFSNIVELSNASSAESSVTAYPNPFEDQLRLLGLNSLTSTVSIWNSEGKLVYQGRPDETGQLRELPSLGRGVYFLSTVEGGHRQTVKVVRQ